MTTNLNSFPRYTEFDPQVPVWCVTPGEGRCLHRFFDTSPVSPSGRYLACLRLPHEDRLPRPGEEAAVVLVDLVGGEERVVAHTAGWETQMGANINWGASDDELFFNDVDAQTWKPVTVKLNPHSGKSERFGRGIYHVSPDGKWALCSSLELMRRTQFGYGVVVPEEHVRINWEPREDDGLFLTNLETGDCRLLVSLSQLVELIPERERPAIANRCYYGFHAKWAPTGDRILFTMRGVAHPWALHFNTLGPPMHFYIFTLRPDGSELKCALDATFWNRGGHHINFYPDGSALSMNHTLDFDHLRFVRCDLDGKNRRVLLNNVLGSGHPTIHPNGRNLLTDSYQHEPMAMGDGTTPLRWLDLGTGEEEHLARIRTAAGPGALRIDPHPAWLPGYKHIAFNAAPDGTRRVFIADLSEKLK